MDSLSITTNTNYFNPQGLTVLQLYEDLITRICLLLNVVDLGGFLATCKDARSLSERVWEVLFSQAFPTQYAPLASQRPTWSKLYRKAISDPSVWQKKRILLDLESWSHLEVCSRGSIYGFSQKQKTLMHASLKGTPSASSPISLPIELVTAGRQPLFLCDGRLAAIHEDHLKIWSPDEPSVAPIVITMPHITFLEGTADNQLLIGQRNGTVFLYSLEDRTPIFVTQLKGSVSLLKLLDDGRLLATSHTGELHICSPLAQEWAVEVCAFPASTLVTILSNGKMVAQGPTILYHGVPKRTIEIWSLIETGAGYKLEKLQEMAASVHGHRLHRVEMLLDGRLVSLDKKGQALLWPAEGIKKAPTVLSERNCKAIRTFPEGKMITAHTKCESVKENYAEIWSLSTEQLLPPVEPAPPQTRPRRASLRRSEERISPRRSTLKTSQDRSSPRKAAVKTSQDKTAKHSSDKENCHLS